MRTTRRIRFPPFPSPTILQRISKRMKVSLSDRPFCAWLVFLFVLTCHSVARSAGLDIYWADVEGGAGTLIVTPAGESILIDTGMPGGRDPGRIHAIASKVAGLKRIDYLITTHLHLDHFGGAAELAQLIPIGTVYDNG